MCDVRFLQSFLADFYMESQVSSSFSALAD